MPECCLFPGVFLDYLADWRSIQRLASGWTAPRLGLHFVEEFVSQFLFRALALAVLVPVGYSWAQFASSSALLAKDGSAGSNSAGSNNTSSNNVSPNPVALN